MKFFKHFKIYLVLLVIITVAILLMLNDFLVYGLALAGIGLFFFWLWGMFIKSKEKEIAALNSELHRTTRENTVLKAENDELRNRKLNVAGIKNILDLGLTEINTNFTRSWNDKFSHGNKSVHFIGALQVNIIAKYGIDLKELRLKYDKEHNVLTVANINPRFLAFNDVDYRWKIAEIMEYKQPWFGAGHWRRSDELQELGAQIKEDLRIRTHEEVKNGPQELDWIVDPLKKQIANTLELLLGAPGHSIKIADGFNDSFKTLDEYTGKDDEK